MLVYSHPNRMVHIQYVLDCNSGGSVSWYRQREQYGHKAEFSASVLSSCASPPLFALK